MISKSIQLISICSTVNKQSQAIQGLQDIGRSSSLKMLWSPHEHSGHSYKHAQSVGALNTQHLICRHMHQLVLLGLNLTIMTPSSDRTIGQQMATGQYVYGCWVCRSSGSSSLRNCRQTTSTDHWDSYCWPTWFLLRRPCHLELTATTHDWHVNVAVLFSETVEDISVSLTLGLHCNLQFSVAASSRCICDVFWLICAFNFRLIIILIINVHILLCIISFKSLTFSPSKYINRFQLGRGGLCPLLPPWNSLIFSYYFHKWQADVILKASNHYVM